MKNEPETSSPDDPEGSDETSEKGTESASPKPARKKAKRYAMRTDPLQFTIAFYERFDVAFLYSQAVTLKYAIEQGEEFKKRLDARIDEWGGIGLTDKYFESLRAQLYFMCQWPTYMTR